MTKSSSTEKATKAPWSCIRKQQRNVMGEAIAQDVVQGRKIIASVRLLDMPEGKANARLIAAAPDLLAMLEELAQMAEDDAVLLESGSAWRPFYLVHRDKILAVVAKAKR